MTDTLPDRRIVVTALGITQILAWGSTFYLLAVLAPAHRARHRLGLRLGDRGRLGRPAGRRASCRRASAGFISSHGGRPVLAGGALLLAAGLAGLGLAPNYPLYLVAWAVVGAGMGAGLYDAAFSTLGNIYGSNARGAITSVTLFGGFASTVCWPLSAWLVQRFGWREACLVYAAIQLAMSLPIHLLALPRGQARGCARSRSRLPSVCSRRARGVRDPGGGGHDCARRFWRSSGRTCCRCCRRAAWTSPSRWPRDAHRTGAGRCPRGRDARRAARIIRCGP